MREEKSVAGEARVNGGYAASLKRVIGERGPRQWRLRRVIKNDAQRRNTAMNLEELEVYQTTMAIGERVWKIVNAWDYFAKDTVGKQFVKAADSMAANISEGFGRFFYKENKQFGYYARGSLYETQTWLTKAHNRGLVENEDYKSLQNTLASIAIRLNNYIRSIGTGSTAVHETTEEYDAHENGESMAGEARVNDGCAATLNDAPQAQMTTNDAAQRPMTRRSRK